jgi:hypothetical protein
MPCHTFLFNINLTTNFISFIDNLTIVGVGNRLLNGITYVPIVLNLGSYQTKVQRPFFEGEPSIKNNILLFDRPFNIWVLECVGVNHKHRKSNYKQYNIRPHRPESRHLPNDTATVVFLRCTFDQQQQLDIDLGL